MKLWIASMECASLAEAGGVKNVTYSLCKEFSALNQSVTLFIPFYSFTNLDNVTRLDKKHLNNVKIRLCGKTEKISYYKAEYKELNFSIVFIHHPSFFEKEAVYTYTEHENLVNINHKKGSGHTDTLFLDTLFAKAVCEYCKHTDKEALPDILHCQDASTALIPPLLQETSKAFRDLAKIKTLVTIHNAGPAYHHEFSDIATASWYTGLPKSFLCGGLNNYKVEPFLLCHLASSFITTVSTDYAKELVKKDNYQTTDGLSQSFAQRLINIYGITNGIDYERYNPNIKKISQLPYKFNPEKGDLAGKYKCRQYFLKDFLSKKHKDTEIFGNFEEDASNNNIYIVYHGRITSQKGILVLIQAIPLLLSKNQKLRFIINGQGEIYLEKQLIELTKSYKNKIIFINGYNKKAARLTTAAGDFLLLPSDFEPCGLEDFIAQIYGTLPIAHKTGGLNKILDNKTGFLYQNNNAEEIAAKLLYAIDLKEKDPSGFNKMIKEAANYVHKKYLWTNVIKNEYLPFFEKILKK